MRALILFALLVAGCNSDALQPPTPADLGSVSDFAVSVPDLSDPLDRHPLVDLAHEQCVFCLDSQPNPCTSHCCGIWPACMPDFGL